MKNVENKPVYSNDIQTLVTVNIGKKACVTVKNKQGKKMKDFIGEVVSSYTSHFVIKIKMGNTAINKSFSYVDFLTNELSIEIL